MSEACLEWMSLHSIVGDSTAVGSNEFLDHRTARRDHFGGDKQCAQLLLVEYQTTSLA
jgi:hypothetical protein